MRTSHNWALRPARLFHIGRLNLPDILPEKTDRFRASSIHESGKLLFCQTKRCGVGLRADQQAA